MRISVKSSENWNELIEERKRFEFVEGDFIENNKGLEWWDHPNIRMYISTVDSDRVYVCKDLGQPKCNNWQFDSGLFLALQL